MRTVVTAATTGRARHLLPVLVLLAWASSIALADGEGVFVTIKPGQPDALIADGKSRTVLVVDVDTSAACWGGTIESGGQFFLQATASKATVSPATTADAKFPADLAVTAGKETGTAEIKVQVSYCPPGSVGAFGVCTDPKAKQSRCEAQISISVGEASAPPDTGKPADRDGDGVPDADDRCPDEKGPVEDDGCPEFKATLGCSPTAPASGDKVVCTVKVQGAYPKEPLRFQWYLGSKEMATTSALSWTWDKAEAGEHDISVDVVGDSRSTRATTPVDVKASKVGDQDGDGVPDDQDKCRDVYGEGADGCPKPEPPPIKDPPPSGTTGDPKVEDPPVPDVDQSIRGDGTQPEDTGPPDPAPLTGIDLERAITAGDRQAPAPGAAAAAGITSAVLIGAKLLSDQLSTKIKPPEVAPADMSAALGSGVESEPVEIPYVRGGQSVLPSRPAGESLESRVDRGAADVQDGAQALEKSRQELDRLVNRVPSALRDSEAWKKHVQPQLGKVKTWTDTAKIRDLTNQIRRVIDLRRQIEQNPNLRRLPQSQREALIWYTRGTSVLSEAAKRANKRAFIDPAKKVVEKIPGVGKRGAALLERHRKDSAELFDGMSKLVPRGADNSFRASNRQYQDLYPETREAWTIDRKPVHDPGFETGSEKAKRWMRELDKKWEGLKRFLRKKLGGQ